MPVNRKHHAIDTATPERWRLLGGRFRKRRVQLGYRHRPAFAAARLPRTAKGNLMIRALNAIENGERPGTYTEETMAMYAEAYEVTEESVYDFLEEKTDELEPVRQPAPAPFAAPPAAPPAGLLRETEDRPWFTSIWDRLLELADRGVSDPTGAQLGLAPQDAEFWDSNRHLSRGDRAWALAVFQRLSAARATNGRANTA